MDLTTDQLDTVIGGLKLPSLKRAVEHFGYLHAQMAYWGLEVTALRRARRDHIDNETLAKLLRNDAKEARSADRLQTWILRRTR